jgi:hypothetical protein
LTALAESIAPYLRFSVASISIKQKVLDAVQRLPADATVKDARKRLLKSAGGSRM